MNKIALLNTYLFVGVIGFIDASYLTYTRLLGITPPCNLGAISGCATVAKSSYSVLLGIPLSVYGMVFYGLALALVFTALIKKTVPYFTEGVLTLSVLGALSSVYFLYLQAFVIKAFCIYCVFSALCTFILLTVAILYNYLEKKSQTNVTQKFTNY